MKVFVNDELCSSDTPAIYANDKGFLLGYALFETIKASDGDLQFFPEHIHRLSVSAQHFEIPFHETLEKLRSQCIALLEHNKLTRSNATIRITLSLGQTDRGIDLPQQTEPTLLISALPFEPKLGFCPKAFITDIRRNEFSMNTAHKTTHYIDFIQAREIAKRQGFDEGILLNTKGNITESSIGNIFFVIQDKLLTPGLGQGILPGIIREKVIAAAKNLGLTIKECSLSPQEILGATEAFHTNSLIDIQSFSYINNHPLKTGNEARVALKLSNWLSELIKF